jgi:pilus assembly protein CpaF
MANKKASAQSIDLLDLEDRIHRLLSDDLETKMEAGDLEGVPERDALTAQTRRVLEGEEVILTKDQIEKLIRGVVDRIVGLGPLEPLLEDPAITEIMVNDVQNVFIERDGKIERVDVAFRDDAHLRHVIDRIVAPIGRRIDESSPLVDARLPDGSRVNVIIPPLAIGGPALTIRKFARDPFTLEKLISLGTINADVAEFLRKCVIDRVSIIISGGTGSGKTSKHSDLVSLESRPPNIEGTGEIPIRTLVRNALRMRPDRIIVGEVRGGEAFDMLQAMNTGHRGSLTTLHANSPADAMIRLESMVLMAGFDMPVTAIRRMIAGAVEVVLQQDRLDDGRRVITAITELSAKEGEALKLVPLFHYDLKTEVHKGRTTRKR